MVAVNEWVPWYRRKGYDGNLTEDEKRHLDSFRLADKHPAADFSDLPSEVQGYLSELELSVYDKARDAMMNRVLMWLGFGAFVIFAAYRNISWGPPAIGYVIGGLILAFAWFRYSRESDKIAAEYIETRKGKGAPASLVDEKLQEYWELDEISRHRMEQIDLG